MYGSTANFIFTYKLLFVSRIMNKLNCKLCIDKNFSNYIKPNFTVIKLSVIFNLDIKH